ncbi:restriction system modified-DNA reader domain-containing protein [Streptomyces albidocamelliae]|uniref:RAMA domain-containing protein n=1 Tax=Streptomyces albidocamelliae TaxID=2981135 RepID=A0ABY6ETU4_9ACTN|nr:hypothetical protein [Streptomyces sp. HUAS 14-6]UXY37816.1 hypothetical protein N8I86_25630 [Streptomyces sp. HUAS 14-6]
MLKKRVAGCGTDKIKLAALFKKSPYWTKLRPQLIALAGRKCWYCEGEVSNSRLAVDHFRPKGGVVEEPANIGYYWLAYEVGNFRLICEFCNSSTDDDPSGKRVTKIHHFPLLNPNARIRVPGARPEVIEKELPILLDPLNSSDCDLLDFDSAGTVRRNDHRPRSALERAAEICRVTESIRIYGLDRPGLTERRTKVWSDTVLKANLLELGIDIGDGVDPVDRVRDLITPKATHSGAALSALRGSRHLRSVVSHFSKELRLDPGFEGITQPEAHTALDLINAGSLKSGVELIGVTDIGEVVAVLLADGRLELGPRSYATPTSAARAATGSADTDGWDFWHIGVANSLVPLSQIRREFNESRTQSSSGQ